MVPIYECSVSHFHHASPLTPPQYEEGYVWLTGVCDDVERGGGFYDTPMWLTVPWVVSEGRMTLVPPGPAADAMHGGGCNLHFRLPPLGGDLVLPGCLSLTSLSWHLQIPLHLGLILHPTPGQDCALHRCSCRVI